MFETGMSALVLKICSEYAKSLGLNFPPCTQQEINAICEWVDKHAVKDLTISQDGYNVTFTFKGEYDTTQEFTITIPKNVNVDELEKVLIGSDSVVVERLENNSGLRVRLAQSVTTQINGKLDKPATPTADSAVTMLADGTVGTKPLSEIGGGGGKLYRHTVTIDFYKTDQSSDSGTLTVICYRSNDTKITSYKEVEGEIAEYYLSIMSSTSASLYGIVVLLSFREGAYQVCGTVVDQFSNNSITGFSYETCNVLNIRDTVTEL